MWFYLVRGEVQLRTVRIVNILHQILKLFQRIELGWHLMALIAHHSYAGGHFLRICLHRLECLHQPLVVLWPLISITPQLLGRMETQLLGRTPSLVLDDVLHLVPFHLGLEDSQSIAARHPVTGRTSANPKVTPPCYL